MGEIFSLNWQIYRVLSFDYLNRVQRQDQKDYYQCRHCGYKFPKQEAKVSGYDTAHSSRHIHCPECGRITLRLKSETSYTNRVG